MSNFIEDCVRLLLPIDGSTDRIDRQLYICMYVYIVQQEYRKDNGYPGDTQALQLNELTDKISVSMYLVTFVYDKSIRVETISRYDYKLSSLYQRQLDYCP